MPTVLENLEALKALLEAPNSGPTRVDIFVGEPTAVMDGDGKAHAYIALYPGPGQEDRTEEDLQASPGVSSWQCQATCAGGDVTRALRAVARLQQTVVGVRLHPDSGVIRKNGDLGAVRKDLTVAPNRWFVPIDLVVEA